MRVKNRLFKEIISFILQEDVNKRYQNPDGTFKKMTCPDNPNGKESKFCGCVRYFMSQGKSLNQAKGLCAFIAQKKKG